MFSRRRNANRRAGLPGGSRRVANQTHTINEDIPHALSRPKVTLLAVLPVVAISPYAIAFDAPAQAGGASKRGHLKITD